MSRDARVSLARKDRGNWSRIAIVAGNDIVNPHCSVENCHVCSSGASFALNLSMTQPIPTIERFMTLAPYSIDKEQSLADAAALMKEHGIRHLPVLHDEQLLGMLTDRDIKLVSAYINVGLDQAKVASAMTQRPYTVSPETPIDEVAATMGEERIGSAVVVKNLTVVGIFTSVDACRALTEMCRLG